VSPSTIPRITASFSVIGDGIIIKAVRYDAVVVGAGPAGAMTAYHLSRGGLKVLLLEKKRLPRFKLCGGCLSARIDPYLPEGWKAKVLNTIRGGILGFRGKEFVSRSSEREVAYIVDRSDFDMFLAQRAVEKGSDLWEGVGFQHFEEDGKIKVFTDKGPVLCDLLIGADGFYSKVANQLGYRKERYFRGVEFWCERVEVREDLKERVIIDIGVVSRGYGWIFPKGPLLSVGENPLRRLGEYVKNHELMNSADLKGVKGWFIPFALAGGDLHLGKGRTFLVGDSANMVDPLIGEGIYWSVKGAFLLSEAILRGGADVLSVYRELVRDEIEPELVSAGKIAALAYRFQRASYRMGKGKALERFLNLLSGGTTYRRLYTAGMPEFITSLLHFENFLHIIIDKILRRR